MPKIGADLTLMCISGFLVNTEDLDAARNALDHRRLMIKGTKQRLNNAELLMASIIEQYDMDEELTNATVVYESEEL
jgi:hypothetical protein